MSKKIYIKNLHEFPTLVDLLSYRAQDQPDQQALTFLTDKEAASISLTYVELHHKAQAIAVVLQSMKAKGERILLLYPSGLEYIAAFFGCLYAGAIAVPVYPPRRNHHMTRLSAIATDAQATFVLTTTSIESSLKEESELAALHCIATDRIASNIAQDWQPPTLCANTLAFLQYTSGSTGTPKGVMVSHGNLLHNLGLLQKYFDLQSHDQSVSWLPLYHDMGLIWGVLEPIYCGFSVTLMSPVAFQQKPWRWLEAISRHKATISGGPNFAYDLCVSKITPEQRETLDLSTWEIAFNGSEPIRSETLERFVEAFASCGFRQSAFYPCYGQAEATLIISGGLKADIPKLQTVNRIALEQNQVVAANAVDESSLTLVGSGQARFDVKVLVVDPETLTCCGSNQVGEIWVSSPSVACGYWQRPDETKHTFDANLADTGEGPFLRTGDLGFLRDGELFVTGRLKDLIIIWGRNHYPQDIELTVEQSHPSLRPNCSAAFSVEVNSSEQLVVVAEVERTQLRSLDVDEVVAAIRQAVSEEHELQVYAVVLLKTGSIPKTSSGKIQRRACRLGFMEDSLSVVGVWKSATLLETVIESTAAQPDLDISLPQTAEAIENWIKNWLGRKQKIDAQFIDSSKAFAAYGIDSMTAVEFAQDLNGWLGNSFRLEANIVWNFPTIKSLVHHLASELKMTTVSAIADSTQQLKIKAKKPHALQRCQSQSENLPLSASQEWVWFSHTPYLMTMKFTYYMVGSLNVAALEQSLNEIVRRHEVLRATFPIIDGKLVQVIAPTLTLKVPVIDLRSLSGAEKVHKSLQLFEEEGLRPFDLDCDPLIRTQLLQVGQHEYLFNFFVDHIVFDAFSLGVFIRELSVLYNAFDKGLPSPLPELPFQFADFAHWQQKYVFGEALESYNSYWQKKLANAQPILGFTEVPPLLPCAIHRFDLSTNLIDSLRSMGRKENVSLFLLLLAAFKVLLYTYTGQDDVLLGVTNANRHPYETKDLIGFLSNRFLLRTDLSGNPSFRELLGRVRDEYFEGYEYHNLPTIQIGQPIIEHEQVLFNFIPIPKDVKYPPILQTKLVNLSDWKASIRDLDLRIFDEEDRVHGMLAYTNRFFDATIIKRLVNFYCQILEQVVQQQEMKLSDFYHQFKAEI